MLVTNHISYTDILFSVAYIDMPAAEVEEHTWRALVGWYGDMDLIPHFRALLGLSSVSVEVTFHDPVSSAYFSCRKELAVHCHGMVKTGLATSLEKNVLNS